MMRNELAFIPDNISAISYASLQMQPTMQHDIPEFQTDSTDNLVEEILKQRAERLQKQQEKMENGSIDEEHKKLIFEIKDSHEIGANSDLKPRQVNKTFYEKKSHHDMIPQLNESMAQKQSISQVLSQKKQSRQSIKHEQIHDQIEFQDRIQTLNNQTNEEIQQQHQKDQNNSFTKKNQQSHYEEQSQKFQLPKIDKFHNQSIEQSKQQKALKLNFSQSPSQKKVSSHSQYSMQLHNFIEEQANEQNSDLKSNSSRYNVTTPIKDTNYNPSSQSSGIHLNKMAHKIQSIQSRLQQKHSNLQIDTPINMFNKPLGNYQFTPQHFGDEEQLVQAITKKLNKIEKEQVVKQYKEVKNAKKIESRQRQIEQIKVVNPMQEVDTDYSDLSRDVKIMEHCYQSNISFLSDQTKQLLSIYESMIRDEEIKQLKKQTMALQIHNHRAKISLRNASYTKKFNYISPIPKNNDKPIQYKPKFIVNQQLIDQLQSLTQQVHDQQTVFKQQQTRLTLLTKYYNYMKNKKIPNIHQQPLQFQYNSQLGRYTNPVNNNNSRLSIDVPFTTTNGFNVTSLNSIHTTNNFSQSPILKKGLANPQKRSSPKKSSPKKKVETAITQPYQQYNLLRYKTQISRQMMLEYEVYNLGRLKRIQDENRLLKKELQFVDDHIEHFDRSFAEQLKRYQQISKPKITYQTFQIIEQQTPYTKSPVSRDYYGNCKGSNNINIYRPDSIHSSPLKSKNHLNKSLSHSKYTIKRQLPLNQTSSKKDITLSQNFLLTSNDGKSDTIVSFFRKPPKSPQKNEYCLYTNKKSMTKKQIPLAKNNVSQTKLSFTRSRQISPRSKNILRFNTQADLSISNSSASKNKLRLSKGKHLQIISSKKISSEYYLSNKDIVSKK